MGIYWVGSVLAGLGACCFHGKTKRNLNILVFILLALVMSCNNSASDEINMLNNYNNRITDASSWLFYQIAKVFSSAGMSFGWFNFLSITFALALIVSTLSLFTESWGTVLSMYSLCGALLDTSLYRQFIASSVIVFGYRYLYLNLNKKKYFLCVVIAGLLHAAMLFFLVFLMVPRQDETIKKNRYKKILWAVFGIELVLFTIANDRVMPGLKLVAGIINNDKLNSYIGMSSGNWGWIYLVLLIFVTQLSLRLLRRKCDDKIMSFAQNINLLSIIFLPLCIMYMVSFSRLYRPLVWIYLLVFVLCLDRVPKGKINIRVCSVIALYICAFFLIFNVCIYNFGEAVVKILDGVMFWH